MSSSDEVNWAQFDRFVLSGVPHAMDIAYDLARSSLSVPKAPVFDLTIADLLFYGPVHSAYRRGILARFLRVLEVLRDDENWEKLRICRSAQLTLIETFAETSCGKDSEVVELLRAWMQVQDALTPITQLSISMTFKKVQPHKWAA